MLVIAVRIKNPNSPEVWTGTAWTTDPQAVVDKKVKLYDDDTGVFDFSDLPVGDEYVRFMQIPRRAKWDELDVMSPMEVLALLTYREKRRKGDHSHEEPGHHYHDDETE